MWVFSEATFSDEIRHDCRLQVILHLRNEHVKYPGFILYNTFVSYKAIDSKVYLCLLSFKITQFLSSIDVHLILSV
jgi:hypothetical protein